MKKSHWSLYLKYGILAAIAYSLPVIVFIKLADYTSSWLLFSGCLLFLFFIALFLIQFNKRRNGNAATGTMLAAGLIATTTGVVISVLLSFILILIFVHGFLSQPVPDKVLHAEPSNVIKDKTEGLAFMIFMTATVGNFSAGSFVTILFPFSLRKDQTSGKLNGKQSEL